MIKPKCIALAMVLFLLFSCSVDQHGEMSEKPSQFEAAGVSSRSKSEIPISPSEIERIKNINYELAMHLMLKETQRKESGMSLFDSREADLESYGWDEGWGVFSNLKGTVWRLASPLRYVDFTIRYSDMLEMDVCDSKMGCMVSYIRLDRATGKLSLFDWYGRTWVEKARNKNEVIFERKGFFSWLGGVDRKRIEIRSSSLFLSLYQSKPLSGHEISIKKYAVVIDEAREKQKEKSVARSEFLDSTARALYTGLQGANEAMVEKNAESRPGMDATVRAGNAGPESHMDSRNITGQEPYKSPAPADMNCHMDYQNPINIDSGWHEKKSDALNYLSGHARAVCMVFGGPSVSNKICESREHKRPNISNGDIHIVSDGKEWNCHAHLSCVTGHQVCSGVRRGPASATAQ